MKNYRILAVTMTAAMVISGCSTSPTGRKQFMLVSPSSAIVESSKAYASTVQQLDSEEKLVKDPRIINRIQTITGRVISQAVKQYPESAKWQWSVAVIDEPNTLNAWCMAGGRMAIYTGIINKLSLSDDEIAQIMGHEIAHALANHTAERMSRAMATNIGLSAAAIFTDNNSIALGGAAMAAKLALELPNSRTAESEADRIGIELATRAGYDPMAAVSLWNKMQQVGGSGGPEFMSTHPSPGNRAATLGELAKQVRSLNPNQTKSTVYPVQMVTDS